MSSSGNQAHNVSRLQAWFARKPACAVSPIELERMLKTHPDLVVVDVRPSEGFAEGHVPGALNLPEERWGCLEEASRNTTYVFYGHTQACHLAAQACVKFSNRCYPVMELEGGFAAWEAAELDTEHEPLNRLWRSSKPLRRCRY